MATKGKISELYDLENIKAQQDKVVAYVEQFIAEAAKAKPIKVQLEGAEKTKDVINGVTKLNGVTAEYQKTVEKATTAQLQLQAAQEKAAQAAIKTQQEATKLATLEERAEREAIKTIEAKTRATENLRKEQEKNAAPISITNSSVNQSDFNKTGTVVNATDLKNAAVANDAAAISVNRYSKEELARAQAVQKSKKELDEEAKQLAINKLLEQQNAAAVKNAAREQIAAKGSLEQRRAALIRLNVAYDNLNATERAAPFGIRLQKTIGGLTTQVKELELATGRTRLNVGNYAEDIEKATKKTGGFASAIGNAYSKLRIFAYLIPGIGIGGLIGLLVEPIVAMGKSLFGATKAQEKAAEAAKKHKEELENLVDSYRDLNQRTDEALGSTITEVTKVQELAGVILNQTNSYKDRNNALKELQGINKNYFGDLTLEQSSLTKLTGLVAEYTNAIIKQAIIKETEQDIGKVGAAYFRQARAVNESAEALKKVKEEQYKTNDAYKTFGKVVKANDKLFEEQQTLKPLAEQFSKLKTELQQLNFEDLKFKPLSGGDTEKDAEKLKAISKKFFADELKDQAEFLKSLSNDETFGLQERLAARKAAYDIEKELAEKQRLSEIGNEIEKLDAVKNQKNVSKIALLNAENEYNEKISEITEKYDYAEKKAEFDLGVDLLRIRANANANKLEQEKKDNEEAQKYFKDQAAQKIKDAQDAAQTELDNTTNYINQAKSFRLKSFDEQEATELKGVGDNLQARQKIEEKYNRLRVQRELEAQRDLLIAAQDNAQKQIAIAKQVVDNLPEGKQKDDANAQLIALQAKLADINQQLSALGLKKIQLKIDADTTDFDKKIGDLKGKIQLIADFTGQVFSTVGDIIGASIEAQKNAIQAQIDEIDKKKEKEIEAANASTATEQEKADRIAIITARAAAQKEALERRQKQLDQQKARFDKASNIANIITTTALAVVTTLADKTIQPGFLRIPLAIAVGALGAARLAAAIATPIPKYKLGKSESDTYEGWGITGDGGKSELHVREDGTVSKTPSTPTLTWIGKKDIIYPDADRVMKDLQLASMSSMASHLKSPFAERDNGNRMNRELVNSVQKLTSVVANKREIHIRPGFNSIMALHKYGNNWNNYINDQTNF